MKGSYFSFILIHSPFVGPYTWMPVAEKLRSLGHAAFVPTISDVLNRKSGFVQAIIELVSSQLMQKPLQEPIYLVMHSAAGAYAAHLREAVETPCAGFIFVDSLLPKDGVSLSAGEPSSVTQQRKEMAREGFLPPWSEWFGEDVVKKIIRDDVIRSRFLQELRPIPVDLMEESIPVSKWQDTPSGYIRLSGFYKPYAEEARSRGWPVIERDVSHLHLLLDPGDVVEMILEITERIDNG